MQLDIPTYLPSFIQQSITLMNITFTFLTIFLHKRNCYLLLIYKNVKKSFL